MNRNRRNPKRARFGIYWRLRPAYIQAQITRAVHVCLHGGAITTQDWTAIIHNGTVTYLPRPARLSADVQRGTQDPTPEDQ